MLVQGENMSAFKCLVNIAAASDGTQSTTSRELQMTG